MGNFKDLRIWKESINLVEEIYLLTVRKDFARDFGLKDQIQRSSVSIPSNIAEGEESGFPKKKIWYLNIAKASAAELVTQLIIANRVGYIDDDELAVLENQGHKIIASIKQYIKYLRSKM